MFEVVLYFRASPFWTPEGSKRVQNDCRKEKEVNLLSSLSPLDIIEIIAQ